MASSPPVHRVWPPNGHLSQWIMDQFEPGYLGHAVDVGASDGISINTTFALERVHRWTVLSVEPNPDFLPMLRSQRAFVENVACAAEPAESASFHIHDQNPESFSSLAPKPRNDKYPTSGMTWRVIQIPVTTVALLLDRWEFPKLDLLCVDTEGTELDVLKGSDLERWKPKVIVVECWDEPHDLDSYLVPRGYKRRGKNVDNHLYLRED